MYHLRHQSQKHSDGMQEPLLAPSASPKSTPRSAPATPDSRYQIHESSRKTHKHNRFKTLFFTPTIRDSGVSLSAAIDNPRWLRPETPISIPPTPCYDVNLPQKELDFLVTELATQFQEPGTYSNYPASDRADSPTLGSDSSTSLPRPRPKTPLRHRRSTTPNGRSSPLPGASHPNSPLQQTFTTPPNRKPRPKSLALPPPPPKLLLPPLFQSLALTDANVSGQPIRYLTPNYRAGPNTLRIGTCTFLNLAYGATVECGLRVEAQPTCQKVILQIVQRVVGTDTDHTSWLLCSETDVSSAFTPTVRSELANRVGSQPGVYHPDREDGGDVWMALAHTLAEPVTPMTTRMPILPATPPHLSPGLMDLLSLLTELRFMHRHFFVVKERGRGISWMSSSLRDSLAETCMLEAFMWAGKTQSPKWFAAASRSRECMFRERIRLPKVPGFAEREEEMGVLGVWMSEDAGGRTDVLLQGCWVCFVVAAGAEEVI